MEVIVTINRAVGGVLLIENDVIGIAGDKRSSALQTGRLVLGCDEAQCHATIGRERIELRQRTMLDADLRSLDRQAVVQGIGQLAVAERQLAVMSIDAIASTIMYLSMVERQRGRIAQNGIVRIAYFAVCYIVIRRRRAKLQALPLSGDTIVWQIREQAVEPVTPEQTVLCMKGSVDLQACCIVKIELGIGKCQRSTLLHPDASAIDQQGDIRRNSSITTHYKVADFTGIPTIGSQIDALHIATLKRQQQIVLYQLRALLMGFGGGHFDEDEQTVALTNFNVAAHRVEIGAVYIHTIARLAASFEPCCLDADAVTGLVMHPKGTGDGGYSTEQRVKTDCVLGKRQPLP